ncbi:hypothetical protein HDU76_005399 [Blyttiomyces sp. JEL0837]|nr:hypothetical protein HDU76_005399 [Blyttiomyces sp. JEL0837]
MMSAGAMAIGTTAISRTPMQSGREVSNAAMARSNSLGSRHQALGGAGADGGIIMKRASNVNLADQDKFHYTASVGLGSGQTFTTLLDTGSSDVWVRGQNCKITTGQSNDGSCSGAKLSLTDSTVTVVKDSFGDKVTVHEEYGPQNNPNSILDMSVYKVPVTIAGVTATTNIGVSDMEYGFPFDGIVGLAFDTISQISQSLSDANVKDTASNYIDALPSGTSTTFGFYLSDNSNGDVGEFTVGGYDTAKTTGTVSYIPVAKDYFWMLDMSAGTVTVGNGSPMSLSGVAGLKYAIVDSGTPTLVLEDSVAASIHQTLGATMDDNVGLYKFSSCSTAQSGPMVTLKIGGVSLNVPPAYYVVQLNEPGANGCYSMIQTGGTGNKLAIIGVPVMRAYYTVFDKKGNQVGFALANHPNGNPAAGGSSGSKNMGESVAPFFGLLAMGVASCITLMW